MEIKIFICLVCFATSGGVWAAGKHMHGSSPAPITVCNGATNDLVFSNNCSGVYYPQMLK